MKTENEIKSIFKSAGLEEPSEYFESNVMERVVLERSLAKAAKPQPIINLKVLIVVAVSIVMIFVLSIAFPESPGETSKLSAIFSVIEDLIAKNYQDWAILPIITLSAFILLLLDNLFNKKRERKFR